MKSFINTVFWHEMRLFGANGHVFHVKVEAVFDLLRQKVFWLTLAAFCFFLGLADTLVFEIPLILPLRILYWAMNVFGTIFLWYGLFFCAALTLKKFESDLPVPTALIHLFAISVMVWVNFYVASFILDEPRHFLAISPSEVLRNLGLALAFEILIIYVVLPNVPDYEIIAPTDTVDTQPLDSPKVSTSLPTAGLRFAKSVEHYLEIHWHDRVDLQRANLRDFSAQFGPQIGIQPHRSFWVARCAIVGTARRRGNMVLVLDDQTEIPVARNRKAEVTKWLHSF